MIGDDNNESGDELDVDDENTIDASDREAEQAQQKEMFGRSEGENRSAEQLWLVSYSDFMTIMMIFFLAMFGYSYIAKQRVVQTPQMAFDSFSVKVSEMKKELGEDLQIQDEVDKVTLELGEGILFRSGSALLSKTARATLNEIGAAVKAVPGDVIVEGHSDNVPISGGRFKTNWELSAARAFSVVDQLSKTGIPASRMAAMGFGEHRPQVPNDSPELREKNRRIEIVILKPKNSKSS